MKKKDYTFKHKRSRSHQRGRSRGEWGSEPGFRASRLVEARRERRRRRFLLILGGGIVLSILVFLGIFFLIRSQGDDAPGVPAGEDGEISSVLVSIRNDAGELDQLLLVAIGADGSFRAVSIPARTVAEVPGRGFMSLRDVVATGDAQLVDQTVADLLQYPVQYHVELGYEELLLAAEQVGMVDLKLRQEASLAVGGETMRLAVGDNSLDSDRAVALLGAAAGDGSAGPVVQASFFQGLRDAFLARSETDREAFARQLHKRVATDLDEDRFVALFLSATGGRATLTVSLLPTRLAGSGEDWYLDPVAGETGTLLGNGGQPAYTMEIRNGTESAGVVEEAAAKLAPLGIEPALQTETSRVNFEFTQIRYGSDAARVGSSVRDLLGAGTLIKDDYLEKNHIIVIIGLDLASSGRGGQQP